VEYRSEGFRLRGILEVVDADGSDIHHDQARSEKQHKLLTGCTEGEAQPPERGAVTRDLEDSEQPNQAQCPKGSQVKAGREVERKNGKQVNESEEAEDEGQLAISNGYTQQVLRSK
jgi:hypothetical protein